ncbi:MAG: DUF3574 domain-containing protein [Blastocatellia bacterium]
MTATKISMQKILVLTVLAASWLAPAAYAQHPAILPVAAPAAKQGKQQQPAAELFVRTELFFGTDTPDGEVSKDEFRRFLKEEVTRRFPDGLTVLTGTGQFRDSESEKIIRERSILLILLYPLSTVKESNEKIEQIRGAYKKHFKQQSVLRVDDPRPVLVSF